METREWEVVWEDQAEAVEEDKRAENDQKQKENMKR